MLHKKIKKIIPIICSLIIGLSGFTVSAASDDVVFSSSDITTIINSSEFSIVSDSYYSSEYVGLPAYKFNLQRKITDLQFDFDFLISSFNVNRFKTYRITIPFMLYLNTTRFSVNDFSIILNIKYDDGSVSSFLASPSSIEDYSSDSNRFLYYIPFDFVLSGNKLLNISNSYFDINYNSPSVGSCSCYLSIKNNESFYISNYVPEYNIFFNSSLNWVSNIFEFVSDNFALVVLCIGFPVVAFAFLLLRRYIHS